MDGRGFDRLFWFYGILGGILALLGAGALFLIWRLFQDHWK